MDRNRYGQHEGDTHEFGQAGFVGGREGAEGLAKAMAVRGCGRVAAAEQPEEHMRGQQAIGMVSSMSDVPTMLHAMPCHAM